MGLCNSSYILPNRKMLCKSILNKNFYSYIWYRYDCKIKNIIFLHNPTNVQKFINSKEFAEMNAESSAVLQSLTLMSVDKNLFKIVDGYVLNPYETMSEWFTHKQTLFNNKPVYENDYFIKVTSGYRVIKKQLLNCCYSIKKETIFDFSYPNNIISAVNEPKTYEEILKMNLRPILKQLKYSIRFTPDNTILKELNKVYNYYKYVERVKNELRGICC